MSVSVYSIPKQDSQGLGAQTEAVQTRMSIMKPPHTGWGLGKTHLRNFQLSSSIKWQSLLPTQINCCEKKKMDQQWKQ